MVDSISRLEFRDSSRKWLAFDPVPTRADAGSPVANGRHVGCPRRARCPNRNMPCSQKTADLKHQEWNETAVAASLFIKDGVIRWAAVRASRPAAALDEGG